MTPEELHRTIEFIIQSQARLAASQEQEREDRSRFEKRLAGLVEWQTGLLKHSIERLDRHDDMLIRLSQRDEELKIEMRQRDEEIQRQAQRRHEEFRQEFRESMSEIRATLDRIAEKLT